MIFHKRHIFYKTLIALITATLLLSNPVISEAKYHHTHSNHTSANKKSHKYPQHKTRAEFTSGGKVPKIALDNNYMFGIDISHYTSDIIWNSLKVLIDNNGNTTKSQLKAKYIMDVAFVIMKATEGTTLLDEKFSAYWDEARRHKIRRGAYHFFSPNSPASLQATYFIKNVGKIEEEDFPPILDIEKRGNVPVKIFRQNIKLWLEIVERFYGRKPIIYSTDAWVSTVGDELLSNYPIWIARYPANTQTHPEEPRTNWRIWQFSEKAAVVGLNRPADLNIIKVDDDFIAPRLNQIEKGNK